VRFRGGSGRLAAGMLSGCLRLIVSELFDPFRHHPDANGQHDGEHDPVEELMLEHLWVTREKAVVTKPKAERDEQDGKEERVIERVRGWTSSLGSFAGLRRFRTALGGVRISLEVLIFAHDTSIA
jgi:hypothetical protein